MAQDVGEVPYRCTTCGCTAQPIIKGLHSAAHDIRLTAFDERYAARWCPWCKRTRECVRAATVSEAVAHGKEKRGKPEAPEQIKGSW